MSVLPSSRSRRVALLVAVTLTALRSLVPLIEEQLNSDEALIGLMAKHLLEGRAFPLHLYSLPHMLGITSWIVAPFFAAGGASVVMLKLPLLLMNVAIAWLLVDGMMRDMRLAPATALIASLPFVLAPPLFAHAYYLDAGGGSPEPMLVVLLLWLLRNRPLAFGALLGIGVLNRPFAGYGALALIAVQCWQRTIFQPRVLKGWLLTAVSFCAIWDLTNSARVWASPRGPGTTFDGTLPDIVSANTAFACFDPTAAIRGSWTFMAGVLPSMIGGTGSMPPLPYVVFAGATAAVARFVWVLRRSPRDRRPPIGFGLYLLIAGLLAAEVFVVARCGAVDTETMRYAILTPLAFVGALAILFAWEPWPALRHAIAGLVCVWALLQFAAHAALLRRAIATGPASSRRELAHYLEAHDIRYSYAQYWDAQALDFLTGERVVIASEDVVRITLYQDEVTAHAREAVRISQKRCVNGGVEAVPGVYWLCSIQ